MSIPIASVQAASITLTPERLAGSSRTLTAIEVSKEGWPDGSSAVVLTRGDDFPDALAGSTLAAAYNSPILLTDSKSLSPETDSEIARLHPSTIYILGGIGAVSASVESFLSSKYTVKRLAGSSRYDTAAAIASYLKDAGKLKTTKAVIAYARNFPDALAISSWAAYNSVPILLSETNAVPDATNSALSDLGITQTIIVGGTGVISSGVESLLPSPTRYGGSSRYETAVNIINGLELKTDTMFVATGENFPDALAGSALAAKTGSAIVLVGATLDSSVQNFLSEHTGNVNNVYVLGGSGVVPTSTVSNLVQKLGGSSGLLKVSFIDVGQADSELIQLPNGKNVLIDAGNNEDADTITSYLNSQGVSNLDIVIATHPHEDHIGAMDTVINEFDIGQVIMPKKDTTTQTYFDLIAAIQNKGLGITEAKAGLTLNLGAEVSAQLVAPNSTGYEDINNYSAVLKLTYGANSFLFEGDADELSENEMINSGYNIDSDVLKVGHHGSATSSTSAFLAKATPEYAIISVGKDNSYGHPTQEAMNRLVAVGANIYRSDEVGTIVATSDGSTITIDKSPSSVEPVTPPPTTTTNVIISSIDLRAEVVTIVNNGSSTADLTGWKLVSETGSQTFNFPSGTTIAAGATLRVASGISTVASAGTLVWTTAKIWNNDGDPGVLFNSSGQEVSRY